MHVKICGVTRLEDAELAASLGAWAIGLNFWPQSKRHVDPGVAAGIARVVRRKIDLVGVFVNQPLDEIAGLVDVLGLTHVQLHGDEGPSFCTAVVQRTGAKVIKAARIGHAADLRDIDRFHTDFHLLDARHETEVGGTGETWDWSLLKQRRNKIPVILAGGLNPENVAGAIEAAAPWGIDVASGVEYQPGIKSEVKLRALFEAIGDRSQAPIPRETPEVLVYPPREEDESAREAAARMARPDGGARPGRDARGPRPGGDARGPRPQGDSRGPRAGGDSRGSRPQGDSRGPRGPRPNSSPSRGGRS